MEKTKKVTKQPAKNVTKAEVKKVQPAKKATVQPKQPVKAKAVKTENVKKVEKVKPVVKEEAVVVTAEAKIKVETETKAKITLNQELNLIIGLFSLLAIITFCFAFQGGATEVIGWELVFKGGDYSSVFKWLMIAYVVSIFIDCLLTIRIDTENEILNIVEKALYMFTAIMNFIVVAVLISLISEIGMGLIIFFILSVVSVVIKFARIFAKK